MTPAINPQYLITIISVIVAFIIFILGVFVYINDRKNSINKIFFGLAIFGTIWITTVIGGVLFKDYSLKTWVGRGGFASATWIFFFIYHFFYQFPVKNNKFKERSLLFLIVSFIVSAFSLFTPFMLKVVEPTSAGLEKNVYSYGYFVFLIYLLVYLGLAIYAIISKFPRLNTLQAVQSKFILAGIVISVVLALITNLFLPKLMGSNYAIQFGPLMIIFFVVFTTYAILKHHIFNLKVITTELSTTVILAFIFIRLLVSENSGEFLWNFLLTVVVIAAGALLIQSVLKEVRQKENLALLTQNLELTNKKLERIDTARREFLSFASHQLRAPMTIIKGYANLILNENYLNSPEKAKPLISKIINSTDQLDRLIKNFLDARAIEEGKMSYDLQPIDLVQLISPIVDEFKSAAAEKGLGLTFEPSKPLITVNADQMKLSQVIQNLVDNAIKYTDSGFVKVSIQDKENSVFIAVADSGQGISPEIKERLFEQQFVRDKETAGETQGTGLGLYIAREIINAHQGKIWAESEGRNKGTTFWVELPA